MKFLSLLVLSAAGTALARGGGSDGDDNDGGGRGGGKGWGNSTATSTKSQCRQVARLTELTTLAADPTKLNQATKNDTAKAEAIKAKASAAAERLTTLQSNTTLMESCSQILAVDAMEHACWKMARLEKLSSLVANQTALDEKTKDDPAKAEKLKTKVADSADELKAMQGNATLVEACASLKSEKNSSSSDSGSQGVSSDNGIASAGADALRPLGTMAVSLAAAFLFGLLAL